MARDYKREELTAEDIKLFQEGKSIMLNPELSDIAKALKKTEKGCRKNKLPLDEAKTAWSAVVEDQAEIANAGYWPCPSNFQYGVEGTVIQILRLSNNLTGLYCDRLKSLPGKSSEHPIPAIDDDAVDKRPAHWIESVLKIFWTQLSDQDIDDIEQDFTRRFMEIPPSDSRLKNAKTRKRRKKFIQALFRGTPPKFISEFQEGCLRLTRNMLLNDQSVIAWSELKKSNPSLTTRYKNELLELVENGMITLKQLESVSDGSPYKVHFSIWNGPQKIFNTHQLVMEIRNPIIHRQFMDKDEEHREVSKKLKRVAQRKGHPGTATTIGWLRIHVDDDNKLCFVDEIQSDTQEEALTINNEAATEFHKQCSKWNIHGFATISNWARKIGYRAAIHSKESSSSITGMTPSDRKWNSYYRIVIKQFGLQKDIIEGYPENIWVEK